MSNMATECNAIRVSAGSNTISALESLAARAEKVVCVTSERFASVTRNEPPSITGCDKEKPRENYPPLFERIRELIESTERSLSGIEDIVRRCEL